MGMPGWWAERRYGLFLDASLASVPAWAPVGAPAEHYLRHLGLAPGSPPDGAAPLVEVLAHHRDRWGHITSYDDFAPLLSFDRFDAEELADLAVRAGARSTVFTARNVDGWCWWDAPASTRTVVAAGPRRNVLAELAAACERNGLLLGASYSLRWPQGAPSSHPDVDAMGAQLCDLVERLGVQALYAASADGGPPDSRIPQLDRQVADRLDLVDPELVVDDELCAALGGARTRADAVVTVVSGRPPPGIVDRPWQLCRPIGRSVGHSRTETASHLMTGADIVALLTEVVAKGGNLLLGIGLTSDGEVPDLQSGPLLAAAPWIRRHDHVLSGARPWMHWGDDTTRYWLRDEHLYATDLSGAGRFPAFRTDDHRVERVVRVRVGPGDGDAEHADLDVPFGQDVDGVRLHLPRPPGSGTGTDGPDVYRFDLLRRDHPVELFDPVAPEPLPLQPLLETAERGTIVQLGDARYTGPATVPDGVTLRGLGPDRSTVDVTGGQLTIGARSRLEHVAVATAAPIDPSAPSPIAIRVAGDRSTVLGCRVDGMVDVEGRDILVRASELTRLRTTGADHLRVAHCRFEGDARSTAITLSAGTDHEIDSCEFVGHRCAILVDGSTGVAISGNHIDATIWGVRLEATENAHVHRNLMVATMRAVDVDGGANALVDGNAVFDGDSGCIVQGGATACEVSGNHWERCRIGMLGWAAGDLREQDNHDVDLGEPHHRFVVGP